MKEKEFLTTEEYIEFYKQQHLDLLERAKTEPISWVDIMRPIQMIYNLTFLYNPKEDPDNNKPGLGHWNQE